MEIEHLFCMGLIKFGPNSYRTSSIWISIQWTLNVRPTGIPTPAPPREPHGLTLHPKPEVCMSTAEYGPKTKPPPTSLSPKAHDTIENKVNDSSLTENENSE